MQRSSPIKRSSLSDKERENNKNSNNTNPERQRQPSTMPRSDASPSGKTNTLTTTPASPLSHRSSPCIAKLRANSQIDTQGTMQSTATGVATRDGPAIDEKDDSLEAAKALAGLQGREEGDGDDKSKNKKTKNPMLTPIATFWRFHAKKSNLLTQARAGWEEANQILNTPMTKRTIVEQIWTQAINLQGWI